MCGLNHRALFLNVERLDAMDDSCSELPSGKMPMNYILKFLREEDGPTAVEYAVMLAMIVMFCLGAIRLLGTTAASSFQESADQMQDAFGGGS